MSVRKIRSRSDAETCLAAAARSGLLSGVVPCERHRRPLPQCMADQPVEDDQGRGAAASRRGRRRHALLASAHRSGRRCLRGCARRIRRGHSGQGSWGPRRMLTPGPKNAHLRRPRSGRYGWLPRFPRGPRPPAPRRPSRRLPLPVREPAKAAAESPLVRPRWLGHLLQAPRAWDLPAPGRRRGHQEGRHRPSPARHDPPRTRPARQAPARFQRRTSQ